MEEHEKLELGKIHGHHKRRESKFEEFEEEAHSHNVYKKDKHHLKIGRM